MRVGDPVAEQKHRLGAAHLVVFLTGLAIALLMAARSQFSEDQYWLLVRGWIWYDQGWLPPFGGDMSGGGHLPGGLTALLCGLPLLVWPDFRAANLFVLLGHVAAYALIVRATRDVLRPHERFLLGLLYWLNPWHLFFSAHIWNPNWMFLAGAAHLWSARRLAREPRFWPSVVQVVTIGLALQVHGSFLILALATALLWLRGYVRPHLGGIAAGAGLVLVSLGPWMWLVAQDPGLLPMKGDGFLGRGLLFVYPVLRGLGYWLRYSVLFFGRQMTRFDFTPALGPAADAVLTPLFLLLTRVVGPATLVVSIAAHAWFLRRGGTAWRRASPELSPRGWLHGYARWSLVAALVSFALSPTTIMMWQGLTVLHAAVLPVVLWVGVLWRTRHGARVRRAAAAYACVLGLLGLGMALGAPLYRKGGRQAISLSISRAQPWLDRLGVSDRTTVVLDPALGRYSCLLEGREGWVSCFDPRKKM